MHDRRNNDWLRILGVVAVMGFVAGCSTVSVQTTQSLGIPSYPPTVPDSVQILQTAPTVPHIRLGEITAQPQGNPSKSEIESKIQIAAAKLGANAVVIVVDRTMIIGATVMGPWWGRSVTPDMGRVIIGVPIRYIQ